MIDSIRDKYKELHNILNINMSVLLQPDNITTDEWNIEYAICGLSELIMKAIEYQKDLLDILEGKE